MSYNNSILVSIAGTPLSGSTAPADLSHYLTIPKANSMYVNEAGDEMTGLLNMKHHKIINVGDPTDKKDCCSKEYVDTTIVKSEDLVVREIAIQVNKAKKELNDLIVTYKSQLENTVQTHVDALTHIVNYNKRNIPAENITSGKLHVDRLPSIFQEDGTFDMHNKRITNVDFPKHSNDAVSMKYLDTAISNSKLSIMEILGKVQQIGVIVNVGPSSNNASHKLTAVRVPLIPLRNINKDCFNLQITPVLDTNLYSDQIFMNIMTFAIQTHSIEVTIITHRSNNEGWGLHLRGHLLISIFDAPQPLLEQLTQ